ncbi:MAG: hypothetical protein ACK2TV_07080 [Anaerolineales bacterium]
MGYVNDVSLTKFIQPFEIHKSAGTWTPDVTSGVISEARSAAAAAFNLFIPIPLIGSENVNQGAKLKSIDIWYKIATAAMAAAEEPVLSKMTLPADSVAMSGADITTTCDAAHDTEAERKAADTHKMTITPASEFYLEDAYAYFCKIAWEGAATSVFTLYGAQINCELRL